jgi:transcription antitermination factor NusG
MKTFNKGWFVMYTRPRVEKRVAADLAEKNIQHYLPVVKTLRKWSDRKKYIEMPLFPSYIFVYLEDIQCYYQSLTCDGFLYYVKSMNESVRVNEKIISDIRRIVEVGKDIEIIVSNYKAGEKLVIKEGPFEGITCEVVQYKNKQKILVHIHCLQRNLLAELPPDTLVQR